nr:hypothetical protein [Tanacetum cinerariifolium]
MNLNFLENKPFVAGTGQAWMFDINYLTDSLNYFKVGSTNLTVGSQGATPSNAGKEDVDRLGLAFPSLNPFLGVGTASIGSSVSAGGTPPVSAVSTPQMSPCASPISADRHSSAAGKTHVFAGRTTGSAGRPVSTGKPTGFAGRPTGSAGRPVSAVNQLVLLVDLLSDPADRSYVPANRILGKVIASASSERFPRFLSVENSDIHDGLKIFDCPKSGIFTFSSYDEDFSGPNANNLESSLNAKMQQFRNQKVWVLVMLPNGKRAIGTKWILKNKRDARGIVCRNKAWLVAQGHRQKEGIDYTDVFAPVARIEAIRLFLAFASFIEFKVYQMNVKSAFLYEKIAEEEKYVADILKKFDLDNSKLASTPFEPQKIREKNVPDEPISVYLYRSMIGCLMYLTATRPDIMFAVCVAARHQVTPKTSNLLSVKRIFKYLTAYLKLGLWYPRDSPFDLEAFSDSDYAGALGDRKSTIGGCQFLGRRLIS